MKHDIFTADMLITLIIYAGFVMLEIGFETLHSLKMQIIELKVCDE